MNNNHRRETVLIINTLSGKSTSQSVQHLTKLAGQYTQHILHLDKTTNMQQLVNQLASQHVRRLVVAGGDGTARLAAQQLAGTDIELAIVPLGTGNLLALNTNIPLQLEAALELAFTGQAKPLSCGLANQQLFLIAAGIGLDAKVMADVTTEHKNRLGVLAYVLSAARYLTDRSDKFTLIIDQHPPATIKAKLVLAANLGRIQAGIPVAPQATADRQELQLVTIESKTLADWLSLAFWMIRGQPNRSHAYHSQNFSQATISLNKPQSFQCDGDTIGKTDKLDIQLKPNAIKLVYGDI